MTTVNEGRIEAARDVAMHTMGASRRDDNRMQKGEGDLLVKRPKGCEASATVIDGYRIQIE